jgi:deoxycytidylate deaminase/dephospho-CoA kinase
MAISSGAFAIGLTGPFGSGCSYVAEHILGEFLQFKTVKLSSILRTAWYTEGHEQPPQRGDLQRLGDELRQSTHSGRLAELAVEELEKDSKVFDLVAIDGIRNLGELTYLRNRFGLRFFLFAVDCAKSQRWGRLRAKYENDGLGKADFDADDRRDRDEEVAYGQQVQLCVDRSDVLIDNSDDVTLTELRSKVVAHVNLVTGRSARFATPMEMLMNLAYSAAHASRCLKRQVGAIIVEAEPGKMGAVVGTGFNENPPPTAPCVEEPSYIQPGGTRGRCYRDMLRAESFAQLAREKRRCPDCGHVITDPGDSPPWRCKNCRHNLEEFFWPERAMSWCTAIHAEVAALFAAGQRAKGATLYTTTFPCFQCAEKIVQAGISAIVFTEAYPDVKAGYRLDLAKIQIVRFEGVRSSRFHDIFSKTRPYFESGESVA